MIEQNKNIEVELIDRAKKGDERAFTELVRRYENMVYSFSYKVCRDKEKATETLQDTFVNVYKNLSAFKGKSKFSTWLYSIVANNCLMKRRKSKLDEIWVSYDETKSEDSEPIEFAAFDKSPAELLMDKELQEKLDKAILRLPPEYRIVFILRDIEGKSSEETARILKLSLPAIKSRLRRARLFLRDELNKYLSKS